MHGYVCLPSVPTGHVEKQIRWERRTLQGEWGERENTTLEEFLQGMHRLSQKQGRDGHRFVGGVIGLRKHTTPSQVYCKGAVYTWKGGDHSSLPAHCSHMGSAHTKFLLSPVIFLGSECSKC